MKNRPLKIALEALLLAGSILVSAHMTNADACPGPGVGGVPCYLERPPVLPSPDASAFTGYMQYNANDGAGVVVYFSVNALTPTYGTLCDLRHFGDCSMTAISANSGHIGLAYDGMFPECGSPAHLCVYPLIESATVGPHTESEVYGGCSSANLCSAYDPNYRPNAAYLLADENFYASLPWATSTPAALNYTSRIISFQPAIGSTTASTNVELAADIYNGLVPYQQVSFTLLSPAGTSTTITIPISVTGEETLSTTTALLSGYDYFYIIQMEPRTGSDATSTSAFGSFTVENLSNTQITYVPANVFGTTSAVTISANACDGTSDIMWILCKAVMPTPTAITALYQVGAIASTKPPAGYFVQVRDALYAASTTASSTISGWTIPTPLMNNFFTPIRTAIGGIIWFLVLIEFWHRLRAVQL